MTMIGPKRFFFVTFMGLTCLCLIYQHYPTITAKAISPASASYVRSILTNGPSMRRSIDVKEDLLLTNVSTRDFNDNSPHTLVQNDHNAIISSTRTLDIPDRPGTTTVQIQSTATSPEDRIKIQPVEMNLELTTSPELSSFILSNQAYRVCDTLDVHIQARSKNNESKPYGGDYFWVWIRNAGLRASAAADVIIDHQNGSYTAKFQLHWSGKIDVLVSLVHSSEVVSILRRVRDNYPARCGYSGMFQSGNISSVTLCHMTTDMYLGDQINTTNTTFCNFTDERTKFPWFCVKPDTLPCDTYISHTISASCRNSAFSLSKLSKEEKGLFTKPKFISSPTPHVTVQPYKNETMLPTCKSNGLPECTLGKSPRPPNSVAGFYYQDQWNSLVCNISHFIVPNSLTQIRTCLQNHTLHFWGDSTLRQWYEYFADILKSTLDESKAKNGKFGPHVAVDKTFNISFNYLHHGFPIRNSWTLVEDIHYVPNMIDDIKTGGHEIVLLTLWAHFTPNDLKYYRQRWQAIKGAVERLKLRNPDARIIIKSANTREPSSIDYGSWYANELDKVMRDIMAGMDSVAIIDVWDMTIGHRTGYRIHPIREVISQEIDMLLSFLCPKIVDNS